MPSVIGHKFVALNFFSSSGDPYAGYNYYVDSVAGNDNNVGTSSTSAFATIAKLLTVWQAGQSVGLAKGSNWREELLYPGNGCSAYAYGTGAKPILDGSNIAAKASISKTVGRTNVYEISVTFAGARAGETAFANTWEDDVNLVLASSVANCDATAGSYYLAAYTGTQTLYIHASDNSDVSANAKVYTYSKRWAGAYAFSYSGCVLNGIRCQKNLSQNGTIIMGSGSTITNCDAYHGSKHNVYTHKGSNLTGVTAQYGYYGTQTSTMFVLNEDTPAGENTTYTNCVANMPTYNALFTGFYGHKNTSGNFGTVTFSGCTVTNCGAGFAFADATTVQITNCITTDCRYAINVANPGTWRVNGGTFTSTIASDAFINSVTSAATFVIDGVIVSMADCQNAIIFSNVASNVTLTNSTLTGTKAATASQIHIWLSNASAVLTCNGNRHRAPNVANGPYIYSLPAGVTLTSDNNLFARSNMWFSIIGNNYTTLATYQAGTGQDAHSTVG